MRFAGVLIACVCGLGLAGCRHGSPPAAAAAPPSRIRFASIAGEAGIDFRLGHGGRGPLTILETSGGGAAFLDFDQDEWPDVLLVGPQNVGLYRNRRDGTFEDVTAASGLDSKRYWMGCGAGDFDGDSLPDLFFTGYRCQALYRNAGNGRFVDVTAENGIPTLDWSLSAAFADVDLDGDLDLFVTQYLVFDETTEQVCRLGNIQSACGPEVYRPLSGLLFRNDGRGRFQPWPGWKDTGKTWGVLISDLLDEGRPAIYLANDMLPGDLWTYRKGRYVNVGPSSGTAFDAQGHLQGGMGVDSGDYDNDGRLDLLVATFLTQPHSLYRNDGNGMFTVTSGPAGIGAPTMPFVGFGTAFTDLDNDGWLDVVIANGHVRDNVDRFDTSQTYRQAVQVFGNEDGRFVDRSASVPQTVGRIVGRGLSVADYNRDGLPDVLVCDLEGQAVLLENQSPAPNHWLRVRLADSSANRAGLGARVTVTAGEKRQIREVKTCGSVLSSLDPAAHFGLGDHSGPVEVTVRWPEGRTRTYRVDAVDREIILRRDGGAGR